MTHDTYAAEHGARRGITYGACTCGWSGPARRTLERVAADNLEHVARAQVVAELHAYRTVETSR